MSACPGDFVSDSCGNWTRVYARTPSGNGRPSPNCLFTYPHSHHFRNLPLTLVASNSDVRDAAAGTNGVERNVATSQNNAKKGP